MECDKTKKVNLAMTLEVCGFCMERLQDCYNCGTSFHECALININDGEYTCPECIKEKESP